VLSLRRLLEGLVALFQHAFDRFLASATILSHAAARIDVIRADSTTQDCGADALVVQPIADTNNHPIIRVAMLATLLSNKCE